jgi:acetyl-CoA carboxylase biotin carboxyl carrier protein
MDTKRIEELIKLMQKYGLNELKLSEEDSKVHLVQSSPLGMNPPYFTPQPQLTHALHNQVTKANESSSEVKAPEAHTQNHKELRSPFVGTFYRASSPKSEPFVREGQRVKKGDTLCIVEAMKLMNEIEAEEDGVIYKIMVENEQPVEFHQVLFLIK